MLVATQLDDDVLVDEKDTLRSVTTLPPTPPADSDAPLHTINDILLHRMPYPPDAPLVGYPQSSHGVRDYAFYTAKDLDKFSNGAAKALKGFGLPKVSIIWLAGSKHSS
jgi:hypothetical protein